MRKQDGHWTEAMTAISAWEPQEEQPERFPFMWGSAVSGRRSLSAPFVCLLSTSFAPQYE